MGTADAQRGLRRSNRNGARPTVRRRGWAGRIERARASGAFTKQDKRRACDFLTCKVSEHKQFYSGVRPYRSLTLPCADPIFKAGLRFASAVDEDRVGRAAKIARQIDTLARQRENARAR